MCPLPKAKWRGTSPFWLGALTSALLSSRNSTTADIGGREGQGVRVGEGRGRKWVLGRGGKEGGTIDRVTHARTHAYVCARAHKDTHTRTRTHTHTTNVHKTQCIPYSSTHIPSGHEQLGNYHTAALQYSSTHISSTHILPYSSTHIPSGHEQLGNSRISRKYTLYPTSRAPNLTAPPMLLYNPSFSLL